MNDNREFWLREGKQSRVTNRIQDIVSDFKGNNLDKIIAINEWLCKNLKRCSYAKSVKVFANRTADRIINDGYSAGCHDEALVFSTMARAKGLPCKYVVGISKTNPLYSGHCVGEAYVGDRWVVVDANQEKIELNPKKSDFYRHFFVIGKGFDSWDLGITTFESWKNKAKEIAEKSNNINKL